MTQYLLSDHFMAIVNLIGLTLDSLGGLFLAYDLLGGEHGPLRRILRVIMYGAIFVLGYILFLGPHIGILFGSGMSILLGFEWARAARSGKTGWKADVIFATARGLINGLAASAACGIKFGAVYFVLASLALLAAYRIGHASPSETYQSDKDERFSIAKIRPSVIRGMSVGLAMALTQAIVHDSSGNFRFMFLLPISVMVVSACVAASSVYVEAYLTNVEGKQIGKIGTCLFMAGFVLQSAQSWRTILVHP